MKREAMSLVEEERKASALVLGVLCGLSEEGITKICMAQRISDDALEATARKMELPIAIVRRVIIRSILPGLCDHTEYYRVAKNKFESRRSSITEVTSIFDKYGRDRVFFLLHTELSMWQGSESVFESLIVEDGHLASECAGYLVKQNKAFQDVIQLLRVSRNENWINWRTLWSYF